MIDVLCKDIAKQLAINRIVETGTDKGETVAETGRWFTQFHPDFAAAKPCNYHIYSVDLDEYSYKTAQKRLSNNPNICLFHSSSEVFLRSLLEREAQEHNNYLFFLDAHWGKYWPLRDEIKVIRQLGRYVIIIDDFFVPGRSDPALPHGPFGFDLYQNTVLCWGYLQDLFEGVQVRIFYPNKPNRDKRGWTLIVHGYGDQELDFMRSLPLFEMDSTDQRHMIAVKTVWRSHWDVKNILKTIVPIDLLRRLDRIYERILG